MGYGRKGVLDWRGYDTMKPVLYTQRVEIVKSYGERRDCADQNIPRFLSFCGYLPVPAPNISDTALELCEYLKPAGIVLTGGNSLVTCGGDAPERDEMERKLLEYAIEHEIPVYGFCRGMQVILDYFGCTLEAVQNHVAVYHRLSGEFGEIEVNSFHNLACREVKEPLKALAWTDDGVIEAVEYPEKRILATMWHPEREEEFTDADAARVRKLFD